MDLYFATEKDIGGYTCLQCGNAGGVSKTFRLSVTPEILIITLKRFDGGNKNNCLIEFPVHDLNMNKYLAANCVGGLNLMYDLYAVVRHTGSLHAGHYTAVCKVQNKWYVFNDNSVREIQEGSVISSSAYILFYQKRINQVHAFPTDVVVFSDVIKLRFIFPAIKFIYVDDLGNSAPLWVRTLSEFWKVEGMDDFNDDLREVHRSYIGLGNFKEIKNNVLIIGVENLTNDYINEILCLKSS